MLVYCLLQKSFALGLEAPSEKFSILVILLLMLLVPQISS